MMMEDAGRPAVGQAWVPFGMQRRTNQLPPHVEVIRAPHGGFVSRGGPAPCATDENTSTGTETETYTATKSQTMLDLAEMSRGFAEHLEDRLAGVDARWPDSNIPLWDRANRRVSVGADSDDDGYSDVDGDTDAVDDDCADSAYGDFVDVYPPFGGPGTFSRLRLTGSDRSG
jgi:hypothetical protein